MNRKYSNYQIVRAWLDSTRDEEIDCDRFTALLAPWLDQRITDPKVLDLLEHHRRLCTECDEEASHVEAALGKNPSRAD